MSQSKKGSTGLATHSVGLDELPTTSFTIAIFGITAANRVILSITGYPVDYTPAKGRDKMYNGIVNYVQSTEEKLVRLFTPDLIGLRSPITVGDVAFLTEELYRAHQGPRQDV